MTLNSSNSYTFTIEQIVRRGFRAAGLMNEREELTQSKRVEGTLHLQRMMETLDAQTFRARSFRLDTVTCALVSGSSTQYENSYDLGTDVIDTTDTAMYIPASESDITRAASETPITRVPRSQIHALPAKAAEGDPTYFWLDYSVSPITVNFWPSPREAGTVRLEVMHRNQNSTDSSKSLDLEGYFVQMACYFVAHEAAVDATVNQQKIQYLWGQFVYWQKLCQARSMDTAARQFTFGQRVYRRR